MRLDDRTLDELRALQGVPETMLYTLYNRGEAARRGWVALEDPLAVSLVERLPGLWRRFGPADPSIAARALLFDELVRPWLLRHPGATVVELGCGLETQFHRLDDGRAQWVAVDVPGVLAVRERLLPASPRCRLLGHDVLEEAWLDQVGAPGFITLQGLSMYLREAELAHLVAALLERFPGVELALDVVPEAWVVLTRLGLLGKPPFYRFPAMRFGVDRPRVEETVRRWSPAVERVTLRTLAGAGPLGALLDVAGQAPLARRFLPSLVHVVGRG